ncbi:MAG: tetratricopeptide repeat protein [Spirochaetes bacterium]|nr:tetratricopeptide repeat protein [Spirochaetota bacterium]
MKRVHFTKGLLIIFPVYIFLSKAVFASYEDALKLFDEKKFQESLKLIAAELDVKKDSDPSSPNYKLRFLAAHNHWKLGNYEPSLLHFKKCMQIRPHSEEPYIDASLMLLSAKKITDAEEIVKRGLEVKKSPMLYYVYGKIAAKNENFWKAKELFEKAISLDPDLYPAYNSLGIVLMKLNKPSEANTAFSAALSLSPNSAEILNNLGYSFMVLRKYDVSIKYFEKALLLSPENDIIKLNLSFAKSKVGK